jgi:hypothetical protein
MQAMEAATKNAKEKVDKGNSGCFFLGIIGIQSGSRV